MTRHTITQCNTNVNQILKGDYTSVHKIGLKSNKDIQNLQDDYSIENKSSTDSGNVNTLSHLLVVGDTSFDEKEENADITNVCTFNTVNTQFQPKTGLLAKKTKTDPVLSVVKRYT